MASGYILVLWRQLHLIHMSYPTIDHAAKSACSNLSISFTIRLFSRNKHKRQKRSNGEPLGETNVPKTKNKWNEEQKEGRNKKCCKRWGRELRSNIFGELSPDGPLQFVRRRSIYDCKASLDTTTKLKRPTKKIIQPVELIRHQRRHTYTSISSYSDKLRASWHCHRTNDLTYGWSILTGLTYRFVTCNLSCQSHSARV